MTEEIRRELWKMETAGVKRAEMVTFLAGHGIKTSEPKLCEFFKPVLAAEYEIRKSAVAADILARAVAESGDLAGGGQNVIGKAFFDALQGATDPHSKEGRALLLGASKHFSDMMKSRGDAAKLAHQSAKLKLDREKFETELAERLLDQALREKLAGIAESNLPRAEKIAQARQLAFADIDALEKSGEVVLPK
jgi:hypothetical protein